MSTTDTSETPSIQLKCTSWRSFAQTYVEDLARGALCLPHPVPLPLLSTTSVELSLPDSVQFTLGARVVQIVTGPHAQQLGGPYAIALELTDLDAERKQQLAQLLDFARAQRSSEPEGSSFAHTMLERSPSIPPREVGLRLSQLPTAKPTNAVSFSAASPQTPDGAATSDEPPSESGYRHTAAVRIRRDEITRPLSPSRARAQTPSGGQQAVPTDPRRLKELLTNVAHKHYHAALRIADELLAANSADPQARRWRGVCQARIALSRNDTALAAQAYEAVLEVEPNDREAREFLKNHQRAKKLESLPFGRYFSKKK